MVSGEQMTELAQGTAPSFIFVSDGMVQHWSQDNHLGILVATNRSAADVLTAKLSEKIGKPVTVWPVGTSQHDTLANRIAASMAAGGANGVFVTDDGKTVQWFEAPVAPAS